MEVKCPQCKTPVTWNNEAKWKPFCSERCRLIDLGQWASEEHRIPGEQIELVSESEADAKH